MQTVTVFEKGEVVIPDEIRQRLHITPGSRLAFVVEGASIRVELVGRVEPSVPETGYGMLVCNQPGERHLSEFDIAEAMRREANDEGY
jgi:antitoxin PrlF